MERAVLLAVMLAAAFILGACKKQTAADDVVPIGDEISKNYSFAGDWYDSAQRAALTLEESGRGYKARLSVGSENSDDMTVWTMTLRYDSDLRILRYQDAVRIDVVMETDEEDAVRFLRETAYENGTGYFFLKNGTLYWTDEKEAYGDYMAFERLQGED